MSGQDSEQLISEIEIKQLSELFDRSENALNPESVECKKAQRDFDQIVDGIYHSKISSNPSCSALDIRSFAAIVRTYCRRYIRKICERSPSLAESPEGSERDAEHDQSKQQANSLERVRWLGQDVFRVRHGLLAYHRTFRRVG